MNYDEMQAAFMQPNDAAPRTGCDSPARRLRDAVEPLATVSFWSRPAYDAYAALGLDFLTGYVASHSSVPGPADPGVVAAAFGVFDPDAVAGLLGATGLSGLQGNLSTELWVGYVPPSYAGSRAWSPADGVVTRCDAWGAALVERGWFPPDRFKRAAG